jgi:hypothetical protein
MAMIAPPTAKTASTMPTNCPNGDQVVAQPAAARSVAIKPTRAGARSPVMHAPSMGWPTGSRLTTLRCPP